MILKIRAWCEELIIAVVLCIIIETLIPNGNNKKYAKVIIGIYIMFITINPILEIVTNQNVKMDEIFNFEYEETSMNLDFDMKDVYIVGIEENIKQEIINMGYKVNQIKISFDNNYENINKIEIEIIEDKFVDANYQEIEKKLIENYFIKKEDIFFTFK